VFLLATLGCIFWRRRVSGGKGEDQVEGQELESNGVEGLPSRQSSYDQTQTSMNDTSMTIDKRGGALRLHDNCSVVRKTKNTPVHRSSGISVTQQLELDDSESICVTPYDSSKPSLETKEQLYASVSLGNQNHDLNPCSPRGKIPRVPGQHTDETNGKEEYIYAVVDKKRKRSPKPFACGPVYAELDFQPSQDEDKFEMTIKEPLTVYASIEEGHIL